MEYWTIKLFYYILFYSISSSLQVNYTLFAANKLKFRDNNLCMDASWSGKFYIKSSWVCSLRIRKCSLEFKSIKVRPSQIGIDHPTSAHGITWSLNSRCPLVITLWLI